MRILILAHAFPPALGGVENVSELLARGFAAFGWDVRVATLTTATLSDEGERPYRILRGPSARDVFLLARWADVVLEQSAFLKFAPALAAARTPRVRVMHGREDARVEEAVTGRARARRRAEVMLRLLWARTARNVVAVSGAARAANRVPAQVVHNGYRDAVFTRSVDPAARQDDRVVMAARLHSEKGVDLALRAVAVLKHRGTKVELRIAGDGPSGSALTALARDLEIEDRVRFLGRLEPAMLNAELNEAAIFLIPSRVREGFPLSVHEAQAAGCAVIGADIGGIPEAMDGHGTLVPPEDVGALADAIEAWVHDRAARLEAVPSLTEMAGKTETSMLERYRRLVEEVVGA